MVSGGQESWNHGGCPELHFAPTSPQVRFPQVICRGQRSLVPVFGVAEGGPAKAPPCELQEPTGRYKNDRVQYMRLCETEQDAPEEAPAPVPAAVAEGDTAEKKIAEEGNADEASGELAAPTGDAKMEDAPAAPAENGAKEDGAAAEQPDVTGGDADVAAWVGGMTVAQLKEELKARGQPVAGKKAEVRAPVFEEWMRRGTHSGGVMRGTVLGD